MGHRKENGAGDQKDTDEIKKERGKGTKIGVVLKK